MCCWHRAHTSLRQFAEPLKLLSSRHSCPWEGPAQHPLITRQQSASGATDSAAQRENVPGLGESCVGQMGQMGRSCIPHSLLLSVPSSCFVFNVTPSGSTMWVQLRAHTRDVGGRRERAEREQLEATGCGNNCFLVSTFCCRHFFSKGGKKSSK